MENEGVNLYGFVRNNGTSKRGFVGLCEAGEMKNIEVTVTLKMLAGNESEEGNDNDKFDDLMDDLVTNGSFEELGGWLEGLASSLDTLMKGFELMNYIREAQTGITVTEAK